MTKQLRQQCGTCRTDRHTRRKETQNDHRPPCQFWPILLRVYLARRTHAVREFEPERNCVEADVYESYGYSARLGGLGMSKLYPYQERMIEEVKAAPKYHLISDSQTLCFKRLETFRAFGPLCRQPKGHKGACFYS